MTPTTFFRLLHVPIDAKGDALAERGDALKTSAMLNATATGFFLTSFQRWRNSL